MSAADKLSMSLDDIIASQKNNNGGGGGHKKNFRPNQNGGGNNKFQKFSNNNNNFKPKHNVAKVNHSHDDRVGGKFHGNKNDVERPLKVITIERPKPIQPGSQQQHHQSHGGSVFERLGKSGIYVTFRNLKRSVQQNDVLELCRAVGEVKEVSLQHDNFGNVARVLFSNDRDAAACVAKYHGVTLDGLEMNVSIENPTHHVKSVFERLETSAGVTGPIAFDPSANVRSGIFGTALSSSSGPLSQKLFNNNNFVADADEDDIEEDEAAEEEEEEEDEGFVRKVTVAQGNRRITLGAAGRGGGRRPNNNRGGRGGGRGNKFNNNKRNNRQNNNNHTPADLDDDLDQYMADR